MRNSHKVSQIVAVSIVIPCLFLLAGIVFAGSSSKAKSVKPPPQAVPAPQSLPLLVDVGADKCIPCIKMAPILEGLKKEYAGVLHVKFVDVWKTPEEAKKYRIMGIPTQIFYDASGKELRRHMGFISKEEILATFEDLGVILRKPVKK